MNHPQTPTHPKTPEADFGMKPNSQPTSKPELAMFLSERATSKQTSQGSGDIPYASNNGFAKQP